ncbi:hypothetical protein I546_3819 [Mycobacterium kansasii 732]|uniref:Uncharacterized protein n=1 Tax=Mycobacterium pseudokansasii TaxID=2341080 RepID=A0A498QU65_9MYCO|nr:hypothetical protein [Mycobacterium pseudokansasii]EUA10091.1 hypothetical protein I546_3819 [Mycobacterium kansasii 732]VAZ95482.1 hypothetical protein LAUMK35_02998 [Mycobacterium pseudokansasii]VAZ96733.1 hypothetical protein LAUMK21_02999 [Mycobacterium pseudokansasii]VBA51010.1 hypothetical protein LAUMK142_02902 [Mycobacterium pseudokansasii]
MAITHQVDGVDVHRRAIQAQKVAAATEPRRVARDVLASWEFL